MLDFCFLYPCTHSTTCNAVESTGINNYFGGLLMNNQYAVKEIKSKVYGAEQILFLLNQAYDGEYTETIEIVRSTLSEVMELADKIE